VLQGTTATIAGVGFTGVSQINLDGAIKGAPPITEVGPYGAPVIPTKPGALGELLNSAPQLLQQISTLTERLGDLMNDRNQKSLGNILANLDRMSGALADRTPELQATLADTRVAIRQAGSAAEQVGRLAAMANGQVGPITTDLRRTVASAQRSMEALEGAVNEARPGLRAFSTQTIPEVGQLVRDLTEMSEALTGVATKLDRGGAGALIGSGKLPDYKPGKTR
jgi:phospholipid/cholesterol/gamma-HCH transport system substrate-binding protein